MVEVAEGRSFVGRAGELARLTEALGRAADGAGRAVIVGGEAGIGKSRLIGRFAEDARASGAQVLIGGCLQFDAGGIPYAPFVEALRGLVRSVEPGRLPALLGPGREELARLLPELGPRSGESRAAPDLDRNASARLFELVLGVFERLAATDPVVLVVEEFQWSDPSTRDLLAFLVRNLRRSRVLVVVTARSEELYRRGPVLPFLAELERADHVQRLELRPFDRDEIHDLLERLLGGQPAAELVDRVLARCAGNPFFVEQLAAVVREGGDDRDLPPRLRDVLLARAATLTDPAQEVLRAAAAGGRRTDDALLAAVLEWRERDVATALREVVERGILVDADGEDDGLGGYAFRHALLQEVVYADLFGGERSRYHAAYARALAALGVIGGVAVTPAELAYHWDAAGDFRHALPALIAAGLAAERVYAFAEARRHYERALELWDRVPDAASLTPGDRVWLTQCAAESAVLAGGYARAVELGRAAIALQTASTEEDPIRVGMLLERLRWYLWEAGDRAAAEAAVDEAIRLIPPEPPSAARARALAHAAGLRLFAGRNAEAAERADEALRIARQADAPSEQALALGVLGWARAVLGEVDRGLSIYREGLAIAERLGGVEGVAIAYTNLSSLLDRVGRTEESLRAAEDGFALAERLGVARTYGGILLGHAAKALINLGRWTEALAVLDRGLDLDPVGRPAVWLRIHQARLDTNQGRFDAAAERLRQVRAIDEGLGPGELYGAAMLAGLAELAVWQGRLGDVRAAATEGLRRAPAEEPPDPALAWLAAVALRAEADAGERARARHDGAALADARRHGAEIAERIDAFERRLGSSGRATTGRTVALAALCKAELSRLEGEPQPAAWDGAAAAWELIGRPYPAAYARYRQAEAILSARGPRAAAAAALGTAHEVTIRLAAEPLRFAVELLARQARIDLGAARAGVAPSTAPVGAPAAGSKDDREVSPVARAGLTERELEVLRLVAGGWSNQQIADQLFITRKTASVHVSNIMGKLAVDSRVEAAAVAHRLGLAADSPPPPDAAEHTG